MTHKRTNFSFSKNTLTYLFFSEKECLNCDSKTMKRLVKKDFIGKGKNIRIKHFGEKPDLYLGKIFYKCSHCDKVFELDELVSMKKKSKNKVTKYIFNIVMVSMFIMILYGSIADK